MDKFKITADFDVYCDVCDELIPAGEDYYIDEFGDRLCKACQEV